MFHIILLNYNFPLDQQNLKVNVNISVLQTSKKIIIYKNKSKKNLLMFVLIAYQFFSVGSWFFSVGSWILSDGYFDFFR